VQLLIPTVKNQAAYVADALFQFGARKHQRSSAAGAIFNSPPKTTWTELAQQAADDKQSPAFRDHATRTFHIAMLLAAADDVCLDSELMAVAATLHDVGLFESTQDHCFTLKGADLALSTAKTAGVRQDLAVLAANAILEHANPEDPKTDIGRYLRAGSLLDVTGYRFRKLNAGQAANIYHTWPRTDFADELVTLWDKECRSVPRGRAAYARCPGGILRASRIAQLPG